MSSSKAAKAGYGSLVQSLEVLLLYLIVTLSAAGFAQAETLDWNTRPATNLRTGGTDSFTYGAAPTVLTVTTSGTNAGSTSDTPVHSIDPTVTANGFTGLVRSEMNATTDNGSVSQTTTITFTEPVYNVSFTVIDIDGGPNYNSGGSQFADWVDISGVSATGAAVLPTSGVPLNAANVSYTAATGRAEAIGNVGISNNQGNITVTFAGPIRSFSVRHIAGTHNLTNDPTQQFVYLDTFTFTRSPQIRIQKTSNGGIDAFNFDTTNALNTDSTPWSAQTLSSSVATAVAGTPVNGAFVRLFANSTATTITETGPTGWVITSSPVTCTDSNSAVSGNPASFSAPVSGSVVTVAAANVRAGAIITCAIINGKRPTLQIVKQSLGGTTSFDFTGSNGFGSATLNTALSNPGSSSVVTLTADSTSTTVTETIPSGWTLTSATCSGMGGSGTATLAGNVLTLNAAATTATANIICTFTSTRNPTLQLAKAWGANSAMSDTANIGATTGGANNTTAFSAAGGTATNSGAGVFVLVGNTITFPAETFTPVARAANYTTVLSCLADGGATANALSGANGQASNSLVIGSSDAGKAIVCTYTNTRRSTTFRLAKSWGANSIAGNVANIAATTGLINNTVAFTSPASTNSNGAIVTVYAGEVATLPAETMSAGSLASYVTNVSCNAGTLSGTNGQASNNLTITAAAIATSPITCTYTNTPNTPALSLQKALDGTGRLAAADQFSLSATGTGAPGAVITTGAGAAITSPALSFTATNNAAYSMNEAMAGGSTSLLGQYLRSVSCSNTLSVANGGTNVSGLNSLPINITPHNGDVISCTITNSAGSPQLALTKTPNVGSVSAAGQSITYTLAVSNPSNVTLVNITLTDALGSVACPSSGTNVISAMAAGGNENCSFSYTTTQADFDTEGGGDGDIDNTASATSTYGGNPVSINASAAVTLVITSSLSLIKSASPLVFVNVGDTVTYTFNVTNTGNQTLTNISVSDISNAYGIPVVPGSEVMFADASPFLDSSDGGANGIWDVLRPGDEIRFTGTYQVIQQDVDLLQ